MVRSVVVPILLMSFLFSTASVAAAPVSVVLPAGSLVLTHLSDPMSSADVHTGDVFQFVVSQDVVFQNLIVVPLGSKGVGHVTEAKQAGSHGKSGSVRLSFDYVFAQDGSQIPVAHNQQAAEADRSYVGGTVIAIVLFWPAIFFHNFVHGKDVTIPSDAVTYVTTLAPKAIVVDSVTALVPKLSGSPVPLQNGSPVPTIPVVASPLPAPKTP
jgi:hypothetical protein